MPYCEALELKPDYDSTTSKYNESAARDWHQSPSGDLPVIFQTTLANLFVELMVDWWVQSLLGVGETWHDTYQAKCTVQCCHCNTADKWMVLRS